MTCLSSFSNFRYPGGFGGLIESRTSSHITANLGLQVMLAPKVNYLRADLARLALKQAEHNRLRVRGSSQRVYRRACFEPCRL